MAVDARYRDKDGEISRKHGDALVGRLRASYGGGFAQGCANDDKLSDVLVLMRGPISEAVIIVIAATITRSKSQV